MPDTQASTAILELSPEQLRSLRSVAERMMPASEEYGVPGADDDAIFADMVAHVGPSASVLADLLARLAAAGGAPFERLAPGAQDALLRDFQRTHGLMLMAAISLVAQCYYRDDRVMISLGLEPRPPFPRGFELEQGDWSLLDPVRARQPFWRDPDKHAGASG